MRTAYLLGLLMGALAMSGCERPQAGGAVAEPSLAVLLVAHGSKSNRWNGMIESLADAVRGPIRKQFGIEAVELAFITEARPAVADALRALDARGVEEILVIPLLVATESTRTNDYLQYLIGMRSQASTLKRLQNEGFDLYYPKARVSLSSALDESTVLKKNILRRVRSLQGTESGEDMAVLLVGYGDQAYGQQMEQIMEGIGRYLKIKTDIDTVAFAFCGKLTDFSGEPTARAINDLFELEEQVLVVPVLIGIDERLQRQVIQAAVNAIEVPSRVRYQPDAILPDPKVNEWVLAKVREAVTRIRHGPDR